MSTREAKARERLKIEVLHRQDVTAQMQSAALAASRRFAAATYLVTAVDAGDPYAWFDLEGGLGFEQAMAVALRLRQLAQLARYQVKVYRGERDSRFTLEEVANLAELL